MAINNKTKATVDSLLTSSTTTESQFKTGLTDVTTQIEAINAVVDTQGLNIGSSANQINALEAEYDAHIVAYNAHVADYNSSFLSLESAFNSHNHHDLYYTEAEANSRFLGISAKAADANLLDGINSTSFLRSDTADSKTSGTLTFSDNVVCAFGSSNDAEFFCNGSHMYIDLNSGIGNLYIRDGSTTRFTFDDAGAFTATGNITAYSDRTVKENIEVIPNALAKVEAVGGYTFNRTDLNDLRQTGVIAQEIQEILPEAVTEMPDGKLAVSYGNLVGLLIEAVKELSAEVKSLKAGE